jgi:hypothetical protein
VNRIFADFQHPSIQTQIVVQQFGGFFHKIKVRQPIGSKDSIQTVCRRSRSLRHFYMKWFINLKFFLEYSRSKLKNQKTISVNVLIKAYPMAPLSCRSNLAGRTFKIRLYLLHVKCRQETMKKYNKIPSKHETGCILSEKK